MPIQLTTTFDPGDLDPGKTYSQVRITKFTLDTVSKIIMLICEYGDTVSSVWVRGEWSKTRRYIIQDIAPNTDYTDLISVLCPNNTTPLYNAVATTLYQWLLDKGYYVGTIV